MNSENNSTEQWYKLNSMSSITAFELSRIVEIVFELKIDGELFKKLPKDVKHHFQKITENEAKGNG